MKRRTRHTLILLGVPLLLVLAFGGWIVDAIRMPFTLRGRHAARRARPHRTRRKPPNNKTPHLDMIHLVRLDIADRETADGVLQLQRLAYRVEADLIGSDGIPPLSETLEELRDCGEEFLAAIANGELAGAISWRFSGTTIDIHRLVVDPDHFRRGIGTALVRGALETEPATEHAIVQTGARNAPAAALYRREGFERIEELELGGVRVSRFAKRLR